jgi:hypothetical protein
MATINYGPVLPTGITAITPCVSMDLCALSKGKQVFGIYPITTGDDNIETLLVPRTERLDLTTWALKTDSVMWVLATISGLTVTRKLADGEVATPLSQSQIVQFGRPRSPFIGQLAYAVAGPEELIQMDVGQTTAVYTRAATISVLLPSPYYPIIETGGQIAPPPSIVGPAIVHDSILTGRVLPVYNSAPALPVHFTDYQQLLDPAFPIVSNIPNYADSVEIIQNGTGAPFTDATFRMATDFDPAFIPPSTDVGLVTQQFARVTRPTNIPGGAHQIAINGGDPGTIVSFRYNIRL